MAHTVVLKESDVVLQADELVVAVSLRIGEGILYAIKKWQVEEESEDDGRRNRHPIIGGVHFAGGEGGNLLLGGFLGSGLSGRSSGLSCSCV